MYLNLDLLYNIDNYLFPLFYYSKENYGHYEVYSPMVFKSIVFNNDCFYLCDFKSTFCTNINKDIMDFFAYKCTFTENVFYYKNKVFMEKCKPFKLNSENLHFLKSNSRINK